MIIDCVGCSHGHYPELEGGDLLIVTGDLTAKDTEYQQDDFFVWLNNQSYTKKIFISGNHDNYIEKNNEKFIKTLKKSDLEYLCDSGTEFEGLKIWGSPWSLTFPGINPKCTAFTGPEAEILKHFEKIPDNIDILITHSPPFGILDINKKNSHCGSTSLRNALERIKPRIHCFSHIHEAYGKQKVTWPKGKETLFINCSHMNENYKPVNAPIRIEI